MYVCQECDFKSAKPGKHCGKPMAEEKETIDEEMGEEEMDEEITDDE